MDKTKSPNFIPPINIMRLEPLKEDNLYTGENPLEFIVVPKCPFLGGFTVHVHVAKYLKFVNSSKNGPKWIL